MLSLNADVNTEIFEGVLLELREDIVQVRRESELLVPVDVDAVARASFYGLGEHVFSPGRGKSAGFRIHPKHIDLVTATRPRPERPVQSTVQPYPPVAYGHGPQGALPFRSQLRLRLDLDLAAIRRRPGRERDRRR